ncbi:SPOR domain-containing protein, partial [Desulfovibrio sulfodismutans]
AQVRPAPTLDPALAQRPQVAPQAAKPVEPVVPARTEAVPPAPKLEAPASGGGVEATYQVASFFKKDQADAMIKKLAQKGVKAEIRPGKIQDKDVFRIAVTLRGTEQEIKAGLEKTGEKGPILLGKKPL